MQTAYLHIDQWLSINFFHSPNIEFLKNIISISVKDSLGSVMAAAMYLLYPFSKTIKSGAQTSIFCAVDESVANQSGLYYADCKVTILIKR